MFLGDSASAERAMARLQAAQTNIEHSSVAMGQKWTAAGDQLIRKTAPIALALGGSAKAFGTFDDAMTKSTAIMGEISGPARQKMEEAAKAVGRTTSLSAAEAAESYFYLASAGMDAEQSIAALPAVARFAQAGMFDMARATDLATDAQSALGLATDDNEQNLKNLTRVTDVFTRANELANTSVEQIAEAMTTKAGAALRAANKEVEEGAAVLAAFADQGVKGATAGERLSIMLRDLPRAATNNADTFREFGIEVLDADGNLRNMADVVAALEGGLGHLSDGQRAATLQQLGLTRAVGDGIVNLLGTSDAIRRYEAELKQAGGTTERVADKQLESFNAQMGLAKDRLVVAGIEIGRTVAPALANLAGIVAAGAEAFASLPEPVRSTAVYLGLAAVAAGPLLKVGGALLTTWGRLATTLTKAGGAQVVANKALSGGVVSATNLVGAINPVTLALGGAATAAFLLHKEFQDGRESYQRTSEAADTLAESLGITRQELAGVGDAADDAASNSESAAVRFAAANADMIAQLRALNDAAAQTSQLVTIGLDLVNHGATPEEALDAVRRLAEAAGVPITITLQMITDGDLQLDAIRQQADALARNVADRLLFVGGAHREAARSLGELAGQYLAAGDQDQFLLTMSAITTEFGKQNLNGQQASIMLGEVHAGLREVTGIDFSKFRSGGDQLTSTLGALTHEGAGTTEQMRHFARAAIDLAAANDGELTPALIDQARHIGESTQKTARYVELIEQGLDPTVAAAVAAREQADAVDAAGDAAGDAVDPTDDLAGSQEDLGDATEETTNALRDQADELKAQTDPLFRLQRAINDVEDAQQAHNDALTEHGPKSREAREAAMRLATAAFELQGASGDAAGSFDGKLTPAMRDAMRAAGLTEKEIRAAEKAFKDAATAGDNYRGNYAATVVADASGALATIASVQARLRDLVQARATVRIDGGGGGVEAGLRHRGGVIDLASAGRWPGLRPDERVTVLKVGEEVLTDDDPRHAWNGGAAVRMHTGGIRTSTGVAGVGGGGQLVEELRALRRDLAGSRDLGDLARTFARVLAEERAIAPIVHLHNPVPEKADAMTGAAMRAANVMRY